MTDFRLDDAIAALASPVGRSLRGIIRLSGPDVRAPLAELFLPAAADRWKKASQPARHAGRLHIAGCRARVPADVYLWPGNRSYTGRPMAEIHMIGSPPLLEAVQQSLYACGVRPAQPGEFTLRAFLSGRIDLVQAEAVIGVIDADEPHMLATALSQLAGGVSQRIVALHEDLLLHLADLEAGLDFVEEDIEFVDRSALIARLTAGRRIMDELSQQSQRRMQSTGRRRVVLAGLPNAGKSALFNALVGREAALVSAAAGTTRDYLAASLDWDGLAIELIDTAGWDAHADAVLHEADARRRDQLSRADLILWCRGADLNEELDKVDAARRNSLPLGRPLLDVLTKSDLIASSHQTARAEAAAVSVLAGCGLGELRRRIAALLGRGGQMPAEMLGSTAARCADSLRGAGESLASARQLAESGAGDELIAMELRSALDALGRIAGRISTDDLLDRIFSRFCIGK